MSLSKFGGMGSGVPTLPPYPSAQGSAGPTNTAQVEYIQKDIIGSLQELLPEDDELINEISPK